MKFASLIDESQSGEKFDESLVMQSKFSKSVASSGEMPLLAAQAKQTESRKVTRFAAVD